MMATRPVVGSSEAEAASAAALTVDQAIAHLEQREDLGLCYYAAWWLGRFRVRESRAVTALLVALEDEADRSPDGGFPLRRNAARALGKVGDRQAISALIDCLTCPDYYVREAAVQSLELLRDTRCIPALLQLLDGGVMAAQLVPGKPHLIQPYEGILEALGTLGATAAVDLIQPFLSHPVTLVEYAAARALYQLTGQPEYGDRLIQSLQGPSLPLRRAALMDLGAIGYLSAAPAVAGTLAENSLKLIALKGILERHLDPEHLAAQTGLPESAVQVMALMDGLL